jgi:hypothetical protein
MKTFLYGTRCLLVLEREMQEGRKGIYFRRVENIKIVLKGK